MPRRKARRKPRRKTTTRSNHRRGCGLEYNPRGRTMTDKARDFVSRHIEHHIRDRGMEPGQAIRAAYEEARREGYKVPRRRNPRNAVIGDEALSLTYRGGQGKRKEKRPWIHRFEHPVRVIGLKDGSVRLKSRDGLPLWDFF